MITNSSIICIFNSNRAPNTQRDWCASKRFMTETRGAFSRLNRFFLNEINRNTIQEIHLQINSRRETNANEPFPTNPWLISHVGKGHTVCMQMNEGSFIMPMIELRWPNTDGFSLSAAPLASYADAICGPEIGTAGLICPSHPLAGSGGIVSLAQAPGCHSQPQSCRLSHFFPPTCFEGRRASFVLAQAAADCRLLRWRQLQKAASFGTCSLPTRYSQPLTLLTVSCTRVAVFSGCQEAATLPCWAPIYLVD